MFINFVHKKGKKKLMFLNLNLIPYILLFFSVSDTSSLVSSEAADVFNV